MTQDLTNRTPGVNWWPEETATSEEIALAAKNLQEVGNRVDYICTHCGNMEAIQELRASKPYMSNLRVCQQSIALSRLLMKTSYKGWYCGHYHIDARVQKCIFTYRGFYELR